MDAGHEARDDNRKTTAAASGPEARLGVEFGAEQRHHVDGVARKDREVRMALEQLRRCLMRRRTHDHEHCQLIDDVRHALGDVRLVGPSGPPM